MSNNNLKNAKKNKNDEFYTLFGDIENELKNYKNQFRDKVVLCNCDDPEKSNFWKYFKINFENFGLKKIVSNHLVKDGLSYKLEFDGKQTLKTNLIGNGDFRSSESISMLKEADILVTNPPFSLFREYVAQLIKYNKKFLILGSQNAITFKDIFKLMKENVIWLGYKVGAFRFEVPNDYATGNLEIGEDGKKYAKLGNIAWFTNLETTKRYEPLILHKSYTPKDYPKYDNYDAINVNRIIDIPIDYFEPMGVPITFMDKYNPEQFEILGITSGRDEFESIPTKRYKNPKQINKDGSITNGSKANTRATLLLSNAPTGIYYVADNADSPFSILYARIIIKRFEGVKPQL